MFQELEVRDFFYSFMNILGILALIAFNYIFVLGKTKNMGALSLLIGEKITQKTDNKILTSSKFLNMLDCTVLLVLQYIPAAFNVIFGELFGIGANYFFVVYFAPVFMLVGCMLLWVNPIKHMNWAVPAYPLALFFVKLGCAAAGCCNGIAWNYGIMNYDWERCEVPIQFIEAIVALIIFFILFKLRKTAKDGILYPIYVILYSGIRFFTEFLRGEENIWGPFKIYHIFCFIGVIYGVILLLIVNKYRFKITELYEETTYFTKGEFHKKVASIRKDVQLKEIAREKQMIKNNFNKQNKKKR